MSEVKEQLSEQEVNEVLNVFDFLEFSNAYRESYRSAFLNPTTINEQLKNLNMDTASVSVEQIEKALKNPKASESILRTYAMNMEVQNMNYKRMIQYFSDMAAFNINYDCINIEKPSDLKSAAFKKDLKVLDDFCSKFNFAQEFRIVLRQILRQGVFYCVLVKDKDKYVLQELPAEYCLITGRHPYGFLFDFNLQWFSQSGVDISKYPSQFKRAYKGLYENIDKEKRSVYQNWYKCSPMNGFWAWKISPEVATLVPYFSAMFPDMGFQKVVRGLQNDKFFIEASKLLVGIVGFNKETKSGQVSNQTKMTPDLLGKFLGVARQGLSKQIGLVALPVDDIKAVDFDVSQNNILNDYTKNMVQQGLSSSDVLYSSNKLNSHQSKLASAIDGNFIKGLYAMFADFVNFFVNKDTEKFKFRVSFHDINVPDDRNERESRFKNFAAMGIVDTQYLARVFDVSPFELDRRLLMSKNSKLEDKLIPLMSLNNQSPGANGAVGSKVGRPSKKDDPTADNDSTEASWSRDSNSLK